MKILLLDKNINFSKSKKDNYDKLYIDDFEIDILNNQEEILKQNLLSYDYLILDISCIEKGELKEICSKANNLKIILIIDEINNDLYEILKQLKIFSVIKQPVKHKDVLEHLRGLKTQKDMSIMCEPPSYAKYFVDKSKNFNNIINLELDKYDMDKKLSGYKYLKTALMFAISDLEKLENINKNIYLDISKKYKTSVSNVEKCIRKVIEKAFYIGNCDYFDKVFNIIEKNYKKPTNSQFITKVAHIIKNNII